MPAFAWVCVVIGFIILWFYGIQLIIIAFRESIAWGLMYLFVPFANLYYVISRWDKCKSPFLKSLLALPFIILGFYLLNTSIAGPGYEMIDGLTQL